MPVDASSPVGRSTARVLASGVVASGRARDAETSVPLMSPTRRRASAWRSKRAIGLDFVSPSISQAGAYDVLPPIPDG